LATKDKDERETFPSGDWVSLILKDDKAEEAGDEGGKDIVSDVDPAGPRFLNGSCCCLDPSSRDE